MRDLSIESTARVSAELEAFKRARGGEVSEGELEQKKMELSEAAQQEMEVTLKARFGFDEEVLAAATERFQHNEEVQQAMVEIQQAMLGDEACVGPPEIASARARPPP
jgi:hypothetical protein